MENSGIIYGLCYAILAPFNGVASKKLEDFNILLLCAYRATFLLIISCPIVFYLEKRNYQKLKRRNFKISVEEDSKAISTTKSSNLETKLLKYDPFPITANFKQLIFLIGKAVTGNLGLFCYFY